MRILFIFAVLALGACAHSGGPKVAASKTWNRTPAQDNSETALSHVSKDGRYIAFFEENVSDGSGAYDTTFRILDIKEDKYVFTRTLVSQDSESVPEAEMAKIPAQQKADLLTLAKSKIASLKLVASTLQPIKNYSTLGKGGDFGNEGLTLKDSFSIGSKKYDFEITTVAAGAKDFHAKSLWCVDSGFDMLMYKMTVNSEAIHTDKRVPLSRGCPMGYGVDKVYNINGKPLLFIRYKRIGFEGPDFRTITLPVNL